MSGESGWGDLEFVVGARGWDHDAWIGASTRMICQ